ncbi:Lrp/AsnC family transcriptional regulator [Luteimonas sp. SDU101]|uniref:Lrp/AsnC family transcriptional regulator n=1 Tax=Luteimonas sp. SDU101 TaxID=3422593 RepID=UPI003EBE3682
MDAIDRRLLALLREDASVPLKTLAAEVGLSRSTVRDRIARMEASGVISRYTIELARDPRGVGAVCALRLARTPDPVVVAAAMSMPEVLRCYALAGDIDLLLELECPDSDALNAARDRIAAIAGVEEVTTRVVLCRYKSGA